MNTYYGDFDLDATVTMTWGSYDGGTGASITQTGLVAGDVIIFKNGGVAQKTTTNGITVNNDFDTRTGLHLISIDTSNDTGDAGFWVTGADYQVAIDAVTIDAQTVRFWVGSFSTENRSALRPTVIGRSLDVTTTGAAGIDWANVENPTTALDLSGTDIQLVDTTTTNTDMRGTDGVDTATMRGTDNAALASVLGALADTAAAGDPTAVDTIMQYIKQLINILIGTAGVVTFPAEAAPANAVSLAEVIRAIHVDVTGIAGAAMRGTDGVDTATMRGTDSAALASVATEARLAELDAVNLPTDINDIQGPTFSSVTDSLEAIRDRGDAAWTTGAGGSDRLLLVDTTIATLATQTSFTLTAGSADNDAYNNCSIVVEDVATATQKAVGMVLDYVGVTKTVTLKEALAFTIATTDKVYILAENSLKSTVANRQLDVTATGASGIDWGNVENPTSSVDLSATDIQLADTVTTLTGHTAQTGDNFARLGAPAGASVSADIAAVKVDTNKIPEGVDKNIALSNFEFVMYDSTDHITPKTGLTVTGTRSIDGGAFVAVSGTFAEIGNGVYQFDALAADTNGDLITWRFAAVTADDTFFTFKTT